MDPQHVFRRCPLPFCSIRACRIRHLQYEEEEQAEKALNALNGRFYAGRLLMAEYSPVTDFREFPALQFLIFVILGN